MWIRNKETNTLQEIHNADVIKICKKEPEKYELYEKYSGDNRAVKTTVREITDQAAAEKKAKEETDRAVKGAEKKAVVEEEAKKVEEEAEAAATQGPAGGEGDCSDASPEDYVNMKINDLKKVAKEKGIQGFNNMDKATLVAVIQAH